jgi:hypothetical protein
MPIAHSTGVFILLLYFANHNLAFMDNYLAKSVFVGALIISVVFTNVGLFGSAKAESGVGNDVFKVVVSLFGISNSTKDVLTLVNVKDQTKIKLFNAEDPENQGQDKVSYTMTFPGEEVPDSEPYTVCTMTVKDLKLECQEGNNSPLNRPEFVDMNVGGGSSSEEENEDDEEND